MVKYEHHNLSKHLVYPCSVKCRTSIIWKILSCSNLSNLKNEHPNYYFQWIDDLIRTHRLKYKKKIWSSKSFQKVLLDSNVTISYYHCPLFIKGHYMKMHSIHIHWLWTMIGFLKLFYNSIMLWQFKNYLWNSCNVIISYNQLYCWVLCHLNHFYLVIWIIGNPKILQKLWCHNILWTM
jgi:hypothetical protein